ncbi:MAG: hypothetical protein DWQ37_12625 [Planctomycetota bacterium]|nr:MAG: hypothetical protein DWQ37_12625 [Planctomycetota bacterium]
MARKRKHEKRERDRQANRARPVVNGVVLPEGAIPADLSQQAPNNSYSPPLFYVDQPFTCVDCGSDEVWTAEQQKWYYEVAKGPIQAMAIRCRDCRRKHRERVEEQRRKSMAGQLNNKKS